MQAVRGRQGALRRVGIVEQITIDVVLQHEPAGVKPVVKYLAPHDVPAHAPAVLIPLVPQPVVAQDLGVEVVRLEGRVVHVAPFTLKEEEAVVVDLLVATVEAEEDGYVFAVVVVDELVRVLIIHQHARGSRNRGGGSIPRWRRR